MTFTVHGAASCIWAYTVVPGASVQDYNNNNNRLFVAPHLLRAQSTYKDITYKDTLISSHTRTHPCTHTRAHRCTCTYTQTCTHIHTNMHTHKHAHTYTHTHTHTHITGDWLVTKWDRVNLERKSHVSKLLQFCYRGLTARPPCLCRGSVPDFRPAIAVTVPVDVVVFVAVCWKQWHHWFASMKPAWLSVQTCVCVCVCVCVCTHAMCVCMCTSMRAHARVCVCVCVRDREREAYIGGGLQT